MSLGLALAGCDPNTAGVFCTHHKHLLSGAISACCVPAACLRACPMHQGEAEPVGPELAAVCLVPRQVNADGVFRYAQSKWFSAALQRLASTGIRGVAVDVWVGGRQRTSLPGCVVSARPV